MTWREQRFTDMYRSLTIDASHQHLMFAGELLQRAAHLWPERIALVLLDNTTITFKELYQQAVTITHYLIKQTITPEDRLIMLYENSLEFYTTYYGIWQTGAVVVPVNIFLQSHELDHIIQDCNPRFIFVSEKLQSKIPAQFSAKIITQAFTQHLLQMPFCGEIPRIQKSPQELAVLLYTSGTTGLPKGVMLSTENIITSALQGICEFQLTFDERVYAALPLFHSYLQNACLWGAMIVGAATIIIPKIERSSLLKGLTLKPTIFLGIPQLYGLMCLLRGVTFNWVRFFICGGDALPDKIRLAFELIFRRKICNGYGLTEAAPSVSLNLQDHYCTTNNVGKPMVNLDIRLVASAQQQIGEIAVKGNNIMLGYYQAPDITHQTLKNGWLLTGDLGALDQHGCLYICGREKDLIINKGIKIYPQEVENVLMNHPEVTAVGVIGMEDHNTQVPVAFVAVKNNYPELESELVMLCKKYLADYKIPRQFYLEKNLPMTATGKVDKKELRKRVK